MTLAQLMTSLTDNRDRAGKRLDIGSRLRDAVSDPVKGPWIEQLLDDRTTPRPIHEMPRFAIQVISREMTSYHAPNRPYLHIQVTNPDSEQSECFDSELCIARLQLKFDDITKPIKGYYTVEPSDGTEIWDFLAKYGETAELIVVNCDAGLCRSSGIAAAIADGVHGMGFSKPIFETYVPNLLVYGTILMEKPVDLDFPPIVTAETPLETSEPKPKRSRK